MSFITKRERVFDQYELLYDLPARNEGKLKAYASCTDARAWSHFCTDKTEHLVEIIKRNNETYPGKFIPINVIIDLLLGSKNSEIRRLKRKLIQYEEMMAAYDELDLNCDQRCVIENAHAMIKAANRELEDVELNLDMSGFTEGIDSEDFATGKSRGDVPFSGRSKYSESIMPMIKSIETSKSGGDEWVSDAESLHEKKCKKKADPGDICFCDVSTSAHDPRITEMQEALINKDAKLSALQNTIAVMENDVCEPYCIYAHIYTALEKIFATLRQVDKYRLYLDLMSTGKDLRSIDIKGKILFKLKILEKFCIALIAPCSERYSHDETCECYRAEITHIETFAITSSEIKKDSLDSKRAHLVADIMQNEEMKDLLSKDNEGTSAKPQEEPLDSGVDTYNSIDAENLNRLKNLQLNYDQLMSCYENLKHERDNLSLRCQQYEDLEKECNALKEQLREYTTLYNEREHYRKRSEDLDSLKEQYIVLSDETASLETQLRAEIEINSIKSNTIEDLRNENIDLEKRLNDAAIAFEKEKNALQCRLKETECKVMCQEQQIRSLSSQIDRLLEQEPDKQKEDVSTSLALLDEMESLKDQIRALKEALGNSDEEKQQLQNHFQDQLQIINDLKMEIEDWKSTCEKAIQRNDYLEQYTDNFREEVRKLIMENKNLSMEVDDKSAAVANLTNILNNKFQEVQNLREEADLIRKENDELAKKLQETTQNFDRSVAELENEKENALTSLQLARQESQELLQKVRDYDELVHKKEDLSNTIISQEQDCNKVKEMLMLSIEENKRLQLDLANRENNNAILLQELQRLRDVHQYAIDNINNLQDEKHEYRLSLELTRKESESLEEKLREFEGHREQLEALRKSHEKLLAEKHKLESELREKADELDDTVNSVELTKKESEKLLEKVQQSEKLKDDMIKMSTEYQKLVGEKEMLLNDLVNKNNDLDNLLQALNKLKAENGELIKKADDLEHELAETKNNYNKLLRQKDLLQNELDNKVKDNNNLYNTLQNKIEENRDLLDQVTSLQNRHSEAQTNIAALYDENKNAQTTLQAVRRESETLMDKVKQYDILANEYDKLKKAHEQIQAEKERLLNEFETQLKDLDRLETENRQLSSERVTLTTHNEDLEKALIDTRTELAKISTEQPAYSDIKKQIEEMKTEKLKSHNKIRDLLDKLDESEQIISNLNEDVLARDDKIAILQNHINALEDEVRRLHSNLAKVVSAGEGIKDSGYQKIDQSISQLEAHHSKATHNMKMEIARLQHANSQLEQQMSKASEESLKARHSQSSQILHLQSDREIIVSDIKQLEIISIGDSALQPDQSNLQEVLTSLDKIKKHIEAKNSQCAALEQTLLKVQSSSQLLLSKADEAKKIVEKEKQKIVSEKEEAIADRFNMERQLLQLRDQLEKQSNQDKAVIKDLEGEILNQKLIIDKINNSTRDYISKLEEDMHTMKNVYENSISQISELQDKLNKMSHEKAANDNLMQKIKDDLKQKCKEVDDLRKQLNEIVGRPKSDFENQAGPSSGNFTDVFSQTDKTIQGNEIEYNDKPDSQKIADVEVKKVKKPRAKQIPQSFNEVQILTANVEPKFDFDKKSYLTYKMKELSTSRIENFSIKGLDENVSTETPSQNLLDIYNRQSDMQTVSSKVIGNLDEESSKHPQSAVSTLGSDLLSNPFIPSTPEKSTDKELFLIYQDSDGSPAGKEYDRKDTWSEKASSSHPKVNANDTTRLRSNRPNEQMINGSRINEPLDQNYNEDSKDNKGKKEQKLQIIDNNEATRQGEFSPIPPKIKTVRYSRDVVGGSEESSDEKRVNTEKDGFNRPYQTNDFYKKSKPEKSVDGEYEDKKLQPFERDDIQKLQVLTPNKSKDSSEIRPTKFPQDDSNNMGKIPDHKLKRTKDDMRRMRNIQKDDFSSIDLDDGKPGITGDSDYYKEQNLPESEKDVKSHHQLSRVGADVLIFKNENAREESAAKTQQGSFALEYILNTVKEELEPHSAKPGSSIRRTRSEDLNNVFRESGVSVSSPGMSVDKILSSFSGSPSKWSDKSPSKSVTEQSVMVNIDPTEDYENKIRLLTKALESIERDYKKKIDAIKVQYDGHIKSIINEHNQGVKSIQSLHEETLQDVIKIHENEVENLRSMSIDAMRKAEKLEKENRMLKSKLQETCKCLDEEPTKICSPDIKRRKSRSRGDMKMLTKTNVEAFNVKPKIRPHGPCTCSLDVNVSDTIRNIFEQVDVEQRKLTEHAYLKYIANKMLTSSVEALDTQELSFLHFKVCKLWKNKISKEEALQKKIDSLESELMNKQRHAQQHIAELDRKVAEERRRLQEVREAVCRSAHNSPVNTSPTGTSPTATVVTDTVSQGFTNIAIAEECECGCSRTNVDIGERRSAGDLVQGLSDIPRHRTMRVKPHEINRAVLAKLDVEERKDKKLFDEPPTRLRRTHDRLTVRKK